MRASRWVWGSAILASSTLLSLVAPLAVAASVAQSPTAPPWEPDGDAAAPYANVLFFDSAGNQITSGTNLSNPFAYAVATTNDGSGSTKAILQFANPQPNGSPPVPANWTVTAEGGPTTYNPTSRLPVGTPADLVADAATVPVVASSADISTWLSANIPSTATGYANTIEVRIQDSAEFETDIYWETDIGYNTTSSPITVDGTTVPADGWAQLFPFVTSTSTALTATPASPKVVGTKVTLKATVTPAEAGSVQFYDGTTAIGSPVAVAAGAASTSLTPALGAHSFNGVFQPTIGDETHLNSNTATVVGQSTSNTIAYTVDAAPTVTSLAPSLLAAGFKGAYTVTGTGFVKGAKLKFTPTGITVSGFKVVSSTKITATLAAATGTAPGFFKAQVTNADGGTASLSNALQVVAPPTVTAMSPHSAAQGAVVSVTITGTGFSATGPKITGPTGVTFSKVSVKSATKIIATMTVSSTAPGTNLPVTVTNAGKGGYGAGTGDLLTIT